MNIIKFKDTVVENQDWYNNNLRGKYSYWFHCMYAVTFEDVESSDHSYAEYERDIDLLLNSEIGRLDTTNPLNGWVLNCIDWALTDPAYDISKYKAYNSFVPEENIPLDKLKKFRTWLAETLLDWKTLNEDNTHTLQYYAGGMTDDVIKWMDVFSNKTVIEPSINISSCGCSDSSNLSSLYAGSISVCDPVGVYRANLKNAMIAMFTDVAFWSSLLPEGEVVLDEIIKYINGIIIADLPFASIEMTDTYTCGCLSNGNLVQESAHAILRNLIQVFEWIKSGDYVGHKNNIQNILFEWSSKLYENMEWN